MSEQASLLKTIKFRLDDNNIKLTADVQPLGDNPLPEADDIQQQLAADGLADLYFFEGALDKLLKIARETSTPTSLEIAERRNAEYLITVSEDSMQALLTLVPARGGDPVSQEALEKAMQEAEIVSGKLTNTINAAITSGEAKDLIIAKGRPPVDGEDARFESLYEESIERRPEIDEKGRANYHSLGNIATVKPDDPVMRRHPPTNGTDGISVYGKKIAAQPGEHIMYAANMQGIRPDDKDPNLLYSTIAGHPVAFENGVNVEPLYIIDNVDLSTGNIDFDGSIKVNHDVKQGVSIKAVGDIFILGTVEAATIEAGGDIEIAGGIIGHVESQEEHTEHQWSTHISAKKSLRIQFAENAALSAGEKIIVAENVTRCDLRAEDSIIVGTEGCKKGYILGGDVRANNHIQTIAAGSQASIQTHLHVGYRIPDIYNEIDNLEKEILLKDELLAKLHELTRRVDSGLIPSTGNLLEQAKDNINGVKAAIAERRNKIDLLEMELVELHKAKIDIAKRAYTNVIGHIGNESHRISDETIGGQFRLENHKVIYSHTDSK